MTSHRASLVRVVVTFCVLPVLLVLAGCAAIGEERCPAGGRRAIGDSLYFGTSIPAGGVVTSEQWESFVAHEVTPRFPGGLTSWRANGQWLGENGRLEHEDSYVLYIVHPDDPESEKAIVAIIDRYRSEFRQEAVLRVRSSVCVSM